jgi:methylthioribose-1-phosphate isomerase
MRTVEFRDNAVRLVDQTRLPHELRFVECRTSAEVADAIRQMRVRGAPAIGVTAAYGVALGAREFRGDDPTALLAHLARVAADLRATRPTAVNLSWAVDRAMRRAHEIVDQAPAQAGASLVQEVRRGLLDLADQMADEDVAVNRRMGAHGAELVPESARVLTHCNAGALACVDYGTAVGVIRAATEAGKRVHVLVDETRPFLQGARLTAWELQQAGIPLTLITDNMAGHFLSRGAVDLVVVGADRIAANGDVANKIGTYTLAVLCKENGVPFYVAAPTSTVDLSLQTGADIPIEERAADEVTHLGGQSIAPAGIAAAHPAFDVTPARYVTAIITEQGIHRPPYESALRAAVEAAQPSSPGTRGFAAAQPAARGAE